MAAHELATTLSSPNSPAEGLPTPTVDAEEKHMDDHLSQEAPTEQIERPITTMAQVLSDTGAEDHQLSGLTIREAEPLSKSQSKEACLKGMAVPATPKVSTLATEGDLDRLSTRLRQNLIIKKAAPQRQPQPVHGSKPARALVWRIIKYATGSDGKAQEVEAEERKKVLDEKHIPERGPIDELSKKQGPSLGFRDFGKGKRKRGLHGDRPAEQRQGEFEGVLEEKRDESVDPNVERKKRKRTLHGTHDTEMGQNQPASKEDRLDQPNPDGMENPDPIAELQSSFGGLSLKTIRCSRKLLPAHYVQEDDEIGLDYLNDVPGIMIPAHLDVLELERRVMDAREDHVRARKRRYYAEKKAREAYSTTPPVGQSKSRAGSDVVERSRKVRYAHEEERRSFNFWRELRERIPERRKLYSQWVSEKRKY